MREMATSRWCLATISVSGLRCTLRGTRCVPQILRDSAKLPADVVVTGNIDHLVVSDRGALARRLSEEEFGPEDYDELSKLLL